MSRKAPFGLDRIDQGFRGRQASDRGTGTGIRVGTPEPLAQEVAELRREIAQIRIEQDSRRSGEEVQEMVPPPSYDVL